MAKRTRRATANVSGTSDSVSNKQPKTAQHSSPRSESTKPSRIGSRPQANGGYLKTVDESLLAGTSEPPPGSSRGTRKRWRSRQKLKIAKAVAARSFDGVPQSDTSGSSARTQHVNLDPSTTHVVPQRLQAVDRSIFRETTRTSLVRKPTKRWIGAATGSRIGVKDVRPEVITGLRVHEAARTTLVPRPTKQWTELANLDHSDAETPCVLSVASARPLRSDDSNQASLESEKNVLSSVPSHTPTQQKSLATPARSSTATAADLSASPDDRRRRATSARSGIGSILITCGNHGPSARPVASLKASAVPSYSSKTGAQTAFKRFSDFLNNRTGSGSEDADDDDESSGGSEDEDGGVSVIVPAAKKEAVTVKDLGVPQEQVSRLSQTMSSSSSASEFDNGIVVAKAVSPEPESVVVGGADVSIGQDAGTDESDDQDLILDHGAGLMPSMPKPVAAGLVDGSVDDRAGMDPLSDMDIRSEHNIIADVREELPSVSADTPSEQEALDSTAGEAENDQMALDFPDGVEPGNALQAAGSDSKDGLDEALQATSPQPPRSHEHSPIDQVVVRESSTPATQLAQELDDAIVAETSSAEPSGRDFDLPLFNDTRAAAASWPANVGLKRSGSLSGSGRSHDQSKSSQDTSDFLNFSSRLATSQEITTEEADDLDQTIEAISREVFGATRALPDSKQRYSPLKDGDVMVTDVHSHHDLKCLLQNSADVKMSAQIPHISSTSPIVYVCDTLQADSEGTLPVREPMHITADNQQYSNHDDPVGHDEVTDPERSSSRLSDLSKSPTPPSVLPSDDTEDVIVVANTATQQAEQVVKIGDYETLQTPAKKKRKMTGITSKHFSPPKAAKLKSTPVGTLLDATMEPPTSITSQRRKSPRSPLATKSTSPSADPSSPASIYLTPEVRTIYSRKQSLRKSITKTSAFFTPADSPTELAADAEPSPSKSQRPKRRVPAGTSTAPVPPISSQYFGLIQEKLWREPFWLIIAVTFLNKTAGRHAAPIFWELKSAYPTPEALAAADEDELFERIQHLGLGNQRSERLISIAKVWSEQSPERERRHRVLHYPSPGDGKEIKKGDVVLEDSDDVAGALEIGHIPGCGPYAWDSWRIFCRDHLRGVADDYNGLGTEDSGFEPEWQRVLPLDKELRACLRWMWLREGWIWDHESGDKRRATDEEMAKAETGEMDVPDEERKFAVAAATEQSVAPITGAEVAEGNDTEVKSGIDGDSELVATPASSSLRRSTRKPHIARPDLSVEVSGHEEAAGEEDEEIVTSPPSSRTRRGTRKTPIAERDFHIEEVSDGDDDEIVVSPQRKSLRGRKWA